MVSKKCAVGREKRFCLTGCSRKLAVVDVLIGALVDDELLLLKHVCWNTPVVVRQNAHVNNQVLETREAEE